MLLGLTRPYKALLGSVAVAVAVAAAVAVAVANITQMKLVGILLLR